MSSVPSRLMLRHNRVVARRTAFRPASTISEATQAASKTTEKGKEAASTATSKASSGLSRVTSSAGPAMSSAAQGVSNSVNRIGGRLGSLINYIQCASSISFRIRVSHAAQLAVCYDTLGLYVALHVCTLRLLASAQAVFSKLSNGRGNVTDFILDSAVSTSSLLLQSRLGANKACISRSENESTVSAQTDKPVSLISGL